MAGPSRVGDDSRLKRVIFHACPQSLPLVINIRN
jgi:hypothetical protein